MRDATYIASRPFHHSHTQTSVQSKNTKAMIVGALVARAIYTQGQLLL